MHQDSQTPPIIEELSIFLPAFNEEKNIRLVIENALDAIRKLKIKSYEILVIDDGSKDKTSQIVKNLQQKNNKIRLITHFPNKGYGEALKTGFENCHYQYIFYTDSDNQFDISEISKLIEKLPSADVVVGYRMNRKDHLIRKINGFLWTSISNLLLGLDLKDVDCAFKLIKRKVLDKVMPLESSRGAMISPELLAKAKEKGFRIKEVGVHHYPRKMGNPTGNDINVIIQSFKDLFRVWWTLR